MTALPDRPRLAFMASHNGSNMRAIVAACRDGTLSADPVLLVSNNRECGAMAWAADHGLTTAHLSAKVTGSEDALDVAIAECLTAHRIDLVVLAGYMRKLGPRTIAGFPNRILNVHPALLPKFGGRGMYGNFVHEAVLSAGDSVSGATIHIVDGEYDHGAIVAQAEVPVEAGDTPETLAARVQAKERELFPETLRQIVARTIDLDTPAKRPSAPD
ncbi:MAG: phosphoribosylglycinamide formyltransferase [Rhodobacteraceae bacterium]|nr:phosphoribosylglycinamide formyltransferase [Paracoccaceae bacterium]